MVVETWATRMSCQVLYCTEHISIHIAAIEDHIGILYLPPETEGFGGWKYWHLVGHRLWMAI